MNITINNKKINVCLEELQAYKNPTKLKLGKFPYYSIKDYYNRVNAVFGIANYRVSYEEVSGILSVSSGQEFITIKCHLEILDDSFTPVIIREGYGSREVTFNDSGKEVNIHNLFRIASQLAFKAVWDQLNIFGKSYDSCDEYEDEHTAPIDAIAKDTSASNGSSKPQQQRGNGGTRDDSSDSANSSSSKEVSTVWMKSMGEMQIVRHDGDKPVYALHGTGKKGEQYNLVFYPNQYKKCTEQMNRLIPACSGGNVTLSIKASTLGEREGVKQILFKGFAG